MIITFCTLNNSLLILYFT